MHTLVPNLVSTSSNHSSSPSLLGVPGRSGASTPQRISSQDNGYVAASFSGKKVQALAVEKLVEANGFIPSGLIGGEVAWFYDSLGTSSGTFFLSVIHTTVHTTISAMLRIDN